MSKEKKLYLGDGLYVFYRKTEDDIVLEAPREDGIDVVILDFTMLTLLVAYARSKGWKIA